MEKNQQIQLTWIEGNNPLPDAETAFEVGSNLAGLVAAGGKLTVARLCEAYGKGIFPWYSKNQPVLWWSPDPRMVLSVKAFKLHRSLRRTLVKFLTTPNWEIKFDNAFDQVINNCSEVARKGQSGTWIVDDMIEAYKNLHVAGFAHSVETWKNGELVGGLYCVSIGKTIFGESMFATETDASKLALAALVAFARENEVEFIDCQQNTRHLASFGAREIPRKDFVKHISQSTGQLALDWQYSSKHLQSLISKY
jgi:leucyl/phenylalanyl-tRNA--protein transferase